MHLGGHLLGEPLLELRAGREGAEQPREPAQPRDGPRWPIRDHTDPEEGQQVVRAEAVVRHIPDDHRVRRGRGQRLDRGRGGGAEAAEKLGHPGGGADQLGIGAQAEGLKGGAEVGGGGAEVGRAFGQGASRPRGLPTG